ncbi:hypothetical protein PHPALM_29423 [Phytophthora palmivora]|uniref:Uncharacterized protein n=1 Tax=Phytophthora palmivora TaxID=4796 RepID=A0A2P4X7N3_9STRA|nr:hypothetical protein PHPALM_29423 [Phytophthora palmivora]
MLKFESWKREDDEQARKATMQLRRREELALLSQERRLRQELENQLLEQQLAKDKELLELETARRARRKEQQERDEVDYEIDTPTNDHYSAQEPTLIEDSDSDEYASSTVMDALQRPIAELEKKLGIRFNDFSDEEKENESFDESFDARHDSDEEDETIEDDRAKLLQRAKRLLELSSFDTDSDDDL